MHKLFVVSFHGFLTDFSDVFGSAGKASKAGFARWQATPNEKIWEIEYNSHLDADNKINMADARIKFVKTYFNI